MNIESLIARRLAAKKSFRVVTTLADGTKRTHETETMGQAKNWETGQKAKLGKDMINREDGSTVRFVSVEIEAI